MAQNETLQVTDEFIAQGLEYSQLKKSHKKGGPYSKHDRDKRREEVHRLHFEYGYPARKIADMMKISRHTINGDIDHLYYNVFQKVNTIDPTIEVIVGIEQMKTQLTRLREQLDKTSNHSERMSIERLIFEIESKIMHTYLRLSESSSRTNKVMLESVNRYMKQNNMPGRFITLYDTMIVSTKTQEKIDKMIKEDELSRNLKKKR